MNPWLEQNNYMHTSRLHKALTTLDSLKKNNATETKEGERTSEGFPVVTIRGEDSEGEHHEMTFSKYEHGTIHSLHCPKDGVTIGFSENAKVLFAFYKEDLLGQAVGGDDVGAFLAFYESKSNDMVGNTKSRVLMVDGNPHMIFVEFYEAGGFKEIRHYWYGQDYGPNFMFYENGSIKREILFKDGILIRSREFDIDPSKNNPSEMIEAQKRFEDEVVTPSTGE